MLELMGHSKLVGAVSNCAVSAYHGTYAVRLKTAPTGGESVLLFLESTINDPSRGATILCGRLKGFSYYVLIW